jgi:hypothetical protein
MSVGNQSSSDAVSQQITNYTVGLRNLCFQIANLNTEINGQGDGLAVLEALGFDSADAATALNVIGYLNTIAGIYYGTATQGSEYDFNNALAPYWASQ